MNLEQLKKNNIGHHVQLEPPAIYLDAYGRELPARNGDWVIRDVTASEVVLSEPCVAPLVFTLGADHVHSFATNPHRTATGGTKYGFLKLHMQVFIQQDLVSMRPCPRPGERVPPLPVHIAEKDVDSQYPNDSGMQERYQRAGYRLVWSSQSNVSRRIDLEGWELVEERDARGALHSYCSGQGQNRMVLLKTRKPDLEQLTKLPYWRQQPGLVACTVTADASALEFRFQDVMAAHQFLFRMARDTSMFRCAMKSGRLDTVIAHPTSSVAA